MKLQMHRQLFGLHMPMRILMERKIVSQVRVHLCVPVDACYPLGPSPY